MSSAERSKDRRARWWVVDAHAVDEHQRVVRVRAANVDRARAATAAHLVHVHAGDASSTSASFGGFSTSKSRA
jgi:hypothetical protein